MRVCFIKCVGIAALCVLLNSAATHAQEEGHRTEEILTNNSIVKLVRAGFQDKTVIAIIRARPARFDLAPDRLVELKKSGVNDRIVLAMIARDDANSFASDGWSGDDDSFFDGMKEGAPQSKRAGKSDPGETNIFGSGSGSRGRTRSRTGSGANTDDTQTVGSATVHILRPPAEAGDGAAPKLERAPTLTNESVIDLVEAGFSEGTVIRRIDASPVEFNFTPTSLADLHKHRVSDSIIAAMRLAMSDDKTSSQNNPKPEK